MKQYLLKMGIFIFVCYVQAEHIILDLGDLLFVTDRAAIVKQIGLRGILNYIVLDRKNPNLKPLLFDILTGLAGPQTESKKYRLYSTIGEELPQIMVEWMLGKKSGPQIIKEASHYIESLDAQGYFVSHRERTIIERIITIIFTPEIHAANNKVIDRGLKLVKRLAAMTKPDGSPRHTLYILSNWDADSYPIVYKNHPELFDFFDKQNIFISGHIQKVKPQISSIKHVIDTCQLNPTACVFIDDRIENCYIARKAGIARVFQLKRGNFRKLIDELQHQGLID